MKADVFILVAIACIAAPFTYTLMGSLTVRLWVHLCGDNETSVKVVTGIAWPVTLPIALIAWFATAGVRLGHWRRTPKYKLPGARVVKP